MAEEPTTPRRPIAHEGFTPEAAEVASAFGMLYQGLAENPTGLAAMLDAMMDHRRQAYNKLPHLRISACVDVVDFLNEAIGLAVKGDVQAAEGFLKRAEVTTHGHMHRSRKLFICQAALSPEAVA